MPQKSPPFVPLISTADLQVSAALTLYRRAVVAADDEAVIEGDAYTASLLFGMLADAIRDDRCGGRNRRPASLSRDRTASTEEADGAGAGAVSPCWQWNEAVVLLRIFAARPGNAPVLNNHAYAALLKVNEKATESYGAVRTAGSGHERHDGVRCAMSVLKRMKADKVSPDVITCSTLMKTFDKGRNWKAAVTLLNAMRASLSSASPSTTSSAATSATPVSSAAHPSDAADDRKGTDDADVRDKEWSLPQPNTYTYSLVIAACARANQGTLALDLLHQVTETVMAAEGGAVTSAAPLPLHPQPSGEGGDAVWVYNAALLACVESSSLSSSTDVKSGSKKSRKRHKENDGAHLSTAFDILEKMEGLGAGGGDAGAARGAASDASPDTVSYNTVLSALEAHSFAAARRRSRSSRLRKYDREIDVVMDILGTMRKRGVAPDAITYYNAILACRSIPEHALMAFRECLEDTAFLENLSNANKAPLKGRAATGLVFVANAALSVAAAAGNCSMMTEILSMISDSGQGHQPRIPKQLHLNTESLMLIIRTFGAIHDCQSILLLLVAITGQGDYANDFLKKRHSIDVLSAIARTSLPLIEEEVYSTAITCCLKNDELGMADQLLASMKQHGLTPSQRSLTDIIGEYCRMAMASSEEEFKLARSKQKRKARNRGAVQNRNENQSSSSSSLTPTQYPIVEPVYISSRSRAKAALAILRAVDKPLQSPNLLSAVAKACCAAGLWQDARSIVRKMHRAAIHEVRLKRDSDTLVTGQFLGKLPRLHLSLLRFCAKGGDITPALNFADDINFLAAQVRPQRVMATKEEPDKESVSLSSRLLMDVPTSDIIPQADLSTLLERPVGLRGQHWKLILIAASRGGHWKVCVGTLPFIRPYVEETHPMHAREFLASPSSSNRPYRPSLARLNRKYERIARALTAAILCFEDRSQYAWALRAIDDWILWSGRRPRKEAVASACRALAKRYRGQEVVALVTKVMGVGTLECGLSDHGKPIEGSDYTYEKAIFIEAIRALHKNGLYEEADQLYVEGASNGHFPWAVTSQGGKKKNEEEKEQLQLDLHGMNAAVAHAAVRVSLQKEIMALSSPAEDSPTWDRDVLIITGRGRHSADPFKPILRPEVQRMLTEEFYPPLTSMSLPKNMGAILVPNTDIAAWLSHQQQQKGQRMLAVANILRDISSGSRLKNALLSRGIQNEMTARRNMKSEGIAAR